MPTFLLKIAKRKTHLKWCRDLESGGHSSLETAEYAGEFRQDTLNYGV